MAELIQIRLEDFRAFRNATIDFGSVGLNLVAGSNNSGKSALMSGLDVVAGIAQGPGLRHSLGSCARVWARFKLNDRERTDLLEPTPELAQLLNSRAAEWLEWEFAENQERMSAAAVRLKWADGTEKLVATNEVHGHDFILRTVRRPLATSTFELTQTASGSGGGPLDYLVDMTDVSILSPVSTILPEWRDGFFHFNPLRQSPDRESTTSGIRPILRSDGSNLPAVLLYMFTNYPSVWNTLKQLLEEIVPGVGNLMTPIDGDRFQIVFSHQYNSADSQNDPYRIEEFRHNLKDLGTGVEQILMALVVGLTQTARTVIIEEPETGLHPTAQRALLLLLQKWSEQKLIWATTHSSSMLDWSVQNNTTVYAVNRRLNESSVSVVNLNDERAELLHQLGVRLSDVLSAERILIHEGPTDEGILAEWFPELVQNPSVVMVSGAGSSNARHADLLARWIESADGLGTRRLLYIRDRDEIGGPTLERLEASSNVYVLSCREIENFLLDFDIVADVINQLRISRGLDFVETAAMALKAKALADEFKQTVVLKRVIQEELGALYLLDQVTRDGLAHHNAGLAELLAAVIDRLPQEQSLIQDIENSWAHHEVEVNAQWEERWRALVPGADLLNALWQEYLGRGYSKSADGVLMARRLNPPDELVAAIESFIGSDS